MQFKPHYGLDGKHSLLSPSQYHWVNDDDEKFYQRFVNKQQATLGTKLHNYAHVAITLGITQAANGKSLSQFINDVIALGLASEQLLFYSDHCFGTADAIGFDHNILRIFDLKTGKIDGHVEQLLAYAAIFCLEYEKKPFEIQYDLRIYQHDIEPIKFIVDPADVFRFMDAIQTRSRQIDEWEAAEEEA